MDSQLPIIGIIAILLLCLILTVIALGQKRASRDSFVDAGLNLTVQSGPILSQSPEVMTSEVPDVCSDLTEYDCAKTKGCEYSREVGLCVKMHEVREKAAHGEVMNNISFY
jgi:hypothetical protein